MIRHRPGSVHRPAVIERPAPLDEIPLFNTAARAEELLPLVRPGELVEVS